ncbi:MAG: NADH-quinone oxidoreductase subunit NuoB, partial [Lentisphaeria bacterium]|nr:NADH-quinone oxidoreductase subunit NuoB [Lentisphaeria bacterium]
QDRSLADFCGRSLKIRQVSAGGCAACELDFNVLNTLAWDMGRFGIQVAASPRHADCILVTGPVSRNMLTALKKTYQAAPRPVWVIACGTCAVSGGLFSDSPECSHGVDQFLPVDLYVPGCPPHPATLLEGILRLMGRGAGPSVPES